MKNTKTLTESQRNYVLNRIRNITIEKIANLAPKPLSQEQLAERRRQVARAIVNKANIEHVKNAYLCALGYHKPGYARGRESLSERIYAATSALNAKGKVDQSKIDARAAKIHAEADRITDLVMLGNDADEFTKLLRDFARFNG